MQHLTPAGAKCEDSKKASHLKATRCREIRIPDGSKFQVAMLDKWISPLDT
jgi:hypothetical protein